MESNIVGAIKARDYGCLQTTTTDDILTKIRNIVDEDASYENNRFKFKFENVIHYIYCERDPSSAWDDLPKGDYYYLMSGATMVNGSHFYDAVKHIVSLFGGWCADVNDQKFTEIEKNKKLIKNKK